MRVRVRKRTAVAVAITVVGSVGVAVALVSGDPASRVPMADATGPIEGQVHSISLRATGLQAAIPAERSPRFSLLGVAWNAPSARLRGTVQVRTRGAATGTWSSWRPVTVDTDDVPDGTRRERSRAGATAPLWVGPSDGVQVRVAGRRALPAGLRVVLVDPGSRRHRPARALGHQPVRVGLAAATVDPSAAPSGSPSGTASPGTSTSPQPSAPAPSTSASGSASASASASATPSPSVSAPPPAKTSTAPRPAIVTRAQWGADESIVKSPPTYAQKVKVVFVHHTDTGNDYSCADSAAQVRSVFDYHVEVRGWDDIGYNFIVDKCGTLFEGRAGGVDQPVVGAQAYGFNTNSAGVAILGTFTDVAPPQAALDTVARVAAWKLGLEGENPTGTGTLVEGVTDGNFTYQSAVSFKAISGHRDANSTACPGLTYGKLGSIRTTAGQWTTPADLTAVSVAGATKVGTTYYTRGTVRLGWRPAAVTGYDLLDNGTKVASVAAPALSVTKTLAAGTHQLQVVAHNINGTTTKSATFPVIADTTRPVFGTAPYLYVRTGTVSSTKVPVRLRWKVTDDRLLRSVRATKPSAATFATTATYWSTYGTAYTTTTWSLSAADAAGNSTTASVARYVSRRSEFSATRTGTWKKTTNSKYLGGSGLYTSAKGATASWTVTARSVGIIDKRATTSGKFYVYVDGVYAGTVDTRASSSLYRQIQWTRTWSTRGTHTIKLKVAGTSGRPSVAIDGLAYVS